MLRKTPYLLFVVLLPFLSGCFDRPTIKEAKRDRLENLTLVADGFNDFDKEDIMWLEQVGYAEGLESPIRVYGRGTTNNLALSECYDTPAICFFTGTPMLYSYEASTTITGSNDCIDEWGVQLEVDAIYAELHSDIGDLWTGYKDKDFLESLVSSDSDYIKSQASGSINTIDRHLIQKSLLANDIKQLNTYVQGLNNPELSEKINAALISSYKYPHRQDLLKLTTEIGKGIQVEFPRIKNTNVVIKGFNAGGQVDDKAVVKNDSVQASFSCQS